MLNLEPWPLYSPEPNAINKGTKLKRPAVPETTNTNRIPGHWWGKIKPGGYQLRTKAQIVVMSAAATAAAQHRRTHHKLCTASSQPRRR